MSGAYYSEWDPFAAAWLRELIKAGLIADGEVDERSITEVGADDLRGFTQCHFFAGIGGWSYALRLAGWPDDRPVWTGSCPCQPYSVAGISQGDEDERDLWPDQFRLFRQSKPPVFFGEQIADAVRWGWLDRTCVDFESEAYSCGTAVLPALTVNADHERYRIYFVADAERARREGYQPIERVLVPADAPFTVDCNPLVDARRALAGDLSGLLPCDGLSVVMERCALRGYGNAIVPQVAAEFIRAYLEAVEESGSQTGRIEESTP